MFSDNYINLCAERNIAITTAAVEIGYSRNAGLKWASGSVPRKTTLIKIANYFGVPVDDLINEKTAAPEGDGERQIWANAWDQAGPEAREAALAVLRLGAQPPEDPGKRQT